MARTTSNGSSSIDKALSVLEALVEHQRLAEIAERTGLPKPTVHRILRALVERGFARTDGGGVYSPGPRILAVAGQVLASYDYGSHVGAALHDLQQRTGHTVHFAVLSGDAATYVEKVEGTRPYQMASRVGMAVPLHCTAIGKAILSLLRTDEVRAVLDRTGLERRTPHTITSVKAMQRELELVREQGWALDNEENEAGIRCVGAPVLDHRGRVSGAISISTLALEFSEADAHAAAPFVIETATRTSEALGAPEPAARESGVRPTRAV